MDLSTTSGISGIIFSGIYAGIVYLLVVNFMSTRTYLSRFGIQSKWLAFIGLLFTFGYIKHEIGYFTSLDSNYCEQTKICEKLAKQTHKNPMDKIKAFLGFEESIVLEAIGSGIVFVIVGIPIFLFVRPQLLAAFLTGIFAQIISEKFGLPLYFCRTSCNVNPLAKGGSQVDSFDLRDSLRCA
jgi:hypothetical protein